MQTGKPSLNDQLDVIVSLEDRENRDQNPDVPLHDLGAPEPEHPSGTKTHRRFPVSSTADESFVAVLPPGQAGGAGRNSVHSAKGCQRTISACPKDEQRTVPVVEAVEELSVAA